MNVEFRNLERSDGASGGVIFDEAAALLEAIQVLRRDRVPFMAEVVGENGNKLTIGIAEDIGCVQHAASDGTPPYLMAVESTKNRPSEMSFLVGGTPTPVEPRYLISAHAVDSVVSEFCTTGARSRSVNWTELGP
ncbi:MAG: hypothetical protein DWQ37_09965 [Planctomycetota bacterium]|nr:MAG: hypothetical protein DWQ37_09965 [Planctomycetota bacterium]